MAQSIAMERWLSQVQYSHSQSEETDYIYRRIMFEFCKFQNTEPDKILAEYETADEKAFKHKHTQQLQNWITALYKRRLTTGTIKTKTAVIMSFYKYSQLPLGFIPTARRIITYHNRDIEAKEIAQIIAHSQLREKAFFAIMAQSGLRPSTLQKLKVENIEPLNVDKKTYQINVPAELTKGQFGSYVTFIFGESAKYLKQYLSTKPNLSAESLLFCAYNKPDSEVNIKNISRSFQSQAKELRETGNLKYQTKAKGKPAEIRLYNLRKFFKRKCKDMGDEDTNYLMGHTTNDSNGNYRPQSPEYYRKRYEDKALPFLVLEEPSPSDTKELTEALKNTMETQHKEQMEAIKNNYEAKLKEQEDRFNRIENKLFPKQPESEYPTDEEAKHYEKLYKEHLKWEKENPEEVKKQHKESDKAIEEYEKYRDEHPEIEQQEEEAYRQHIENELADLRKQLAEVLDIIKKEIVDRKTTTQKA